MNRSLAMTSTRATAAVAAFAVALLVTGCSNSQFVSGTDVGPVTGAAIQGVVHGGHCLDCFFDMSWTFRILSRYCHQLSPCVSDARVRLDKV